MFLKSGQGEASPPLPSFEFASETILFPFSSASSRLSGGRSHAKVHQAVELWQWAASEAAGGATPARFLLLPQPLLWQPIWGGPGLDRRRKAVPRVPLNMLLQNKKQKQKGATRTKSLCVLTTVGRGILPLVLNNSFKKLFRNKANTRWDWKC